MDESGIEQRTLARGRRRDGWNSNELYGGEWEEEPAEKTNSSSIERSDRTAKKRRSLHSTETRLLKLLVREVESSRSNFQLLLFHSTRHRESEEKVLLMRSKKRPKELPMRKVYSNNLD